ncbi:YncE family protein [Microcoleus sp. FACHB-672]|uniref:YncE family protein n=1 Tax=Microcoleus sp. FACHB-672 TaxID=2692825 RepID=UPI001683B335|nr:hypothetical protein [Microcoleus sp. FACHB-672]MBD2039376.1 hypothetical protein [Microcoleus sp. FACHB-672]
MISYREQLAKIGYSTSQSVLYRDFFLAPSSLREIMRSMDFPNKFWEEIPGDELDQNWTNEVQGCAFAHNRWFFTSNAEGKRLHVFDGPTGQKIKSWSLDNLPPPEPPLPGFSIYHVGAIIINGNQIYIDHWCDAGGQILVFEGDGATLNFSKWIPLKNPNGRVGMIAIDFTNRRVITSLGKINIDQVYLHDLDTGEFLNKTLTLNPGITDGCYAQGGFLSPNNHLYISSGQGGILDSSKGYQYIYCYSLLNGKLMNSIPVRSAAGRQELQGCCYANITREGKNVFIHAVLLENEPGAKDDIFLKSFTADLPELI